MNWRVWVKQKLDGITTLTNIVPTTSIFAAGSLTSIPQTRPFLIIKIGLASPELKDEVNATDLTISVHDAVGTYTNIDTVLSILRNALEGQVSDAGGVYCIWRGDSDDLSDDALETIYKTSSYSLIGRKRIDESS